MAPGREWGSLASGTRRCWVGAYGGTDPPAQRAERARAAYESGARLPAGHTGHEPASVRIGRPLLVYLGPEGRFTVPENLTRADELTAPNRGPNSSDRPTSTQHASRHPT